MYIRTKYKNIYYILSARCLNYFNNENIIFLNVLFIVHNFINIAINSYIRTIFSIHHFSFLNFLHLSF